MDLFFSVLTMFGGVALFMYGMHVMGEGLQKAAGGRMESMLQKLTSGRIRGVLLGAGVTGIIQSSAATTVTVVGFVNSGVMNLRQAIPVIMGANIGTTVTAWLLSLTGIEGDTLFLRLLKPSSFAPVLGVIGASMVMFSKKGKRKDVGSILMGFAILMFGMETMSATVAPLADMPGFMQLFTLFQNPLLGVLAGALLTALIQSSSASVGILQALAATGGVTYGAAIPIIMGQNIGTCVTALLSGIGTNKGARRASMVHLYFNLLGTGVFMLAYMAARWALDLTILDEAVSAPIVAILHSAFNVSTTLMLLPFTRQLEWLACKTIPDKKANGKTEVQVLLDERLLATPTFALNRCMDLIGNMARMARHSIEEAMTLLSRYDENVEKEVLEVEDQVDHYEDVLGTFVVKLNTMSLSDAEGKDVSRILHGIGEYERISDHAVNLMESARELRDKQISFTGEAMDELAVLENAIREIMDVSIRAFESGDVALAKWVEPLEEVIDGLIRELKLRHIARLRAGKCTVETGFVFADLLTNFERVADHCSNLAVCVIELNENVYNAHEYIQKAGNMDQFVTLYRAALRKYALPEANV